MFDALIGEILLKAAILCGILYLLARHEADFTFRTVAMVTAGITLGSFLIATFFQHAIPWDRFLPAKIARYAPWIGFLPIAALVMGMIVRFCWVPVRKAAVATLIFIPISALISLGVGTVTRAADQAVGKALLAGPTTEKDFQEARAFLNQSLLNLSGAASRPTGGVAHAGQGPATATAAPVEAAPPAPAAPAAGAAADTNEGAVKPAPPAPRPERPAAPPGDWDRAQEQLRVTGYASDRRGQTLALVNGDYVSSGAVVAVQYETNLYRWRAGRIERGAVSWEPIDVRPARLTVAPRK